MYQPMYLLSTLSHKKNLSALISRGVVAAFSTKTSVEGFFLEPTNEERIVREKKENKIYNDSLATLCSKANGTKRVEARVRHR